MHTPPSSLPILDKLIAFTQQVTDKNEINYSGNPILMVSHYISQQMLSGHISLEEIDKLIELLRDKAFVKRAHRLRHYVSADEADKNTQKTTHVFKTFLESLKERSTDGSPAPLSFTTFQSVIEKIHYAAVFTAHPTFALANPVYAELAQIASQSEQGGPGAKSAYIQKKPFSTHRRHAPPTLEEEFRLANEAILRGRNSLDQLNETIFGLAKQHWPEQWHTLTPSPIVLTSWVGYDTDGRVDIGWWDTLRLRLRMKHMQLSRFYEQTSSIQKAAQSLRSRLELAMSTVQQQIDNCPSSANPKEVSTFAEILIKHREDAILSADSLKELYIQTEENLKTPEEQLSFAMAKSGFISHGLSIAHSHVRLNSRQLHNVARQRLGIVDSPENPIHRRSILSKINNELANVQPETSDFGSLILEQASAARLMMTVSKIVKHIDTTSPIRFLVAETESGYTLLVALWLAKLFNVEKHIEISPLFETYDALVHGARIIEEALRSSHWRHYLQTTGKLCLQFGYSDSGRYVGQMASTYLIERLKLQLANLLKRHNLQDVQLVFFDTHGESIGRGAHPYRLADRLNYLSPPYMRHVFEKNNITFREESAFQGGDGYLLFGTQILSNSTITTIVEHIFRPTMPVDDPIYNDPDFSSEFFSSIEANMNGLVEDKGYAALLGSFGPSLIDKTGSRPSARQSDGSAGSIQIRHPSELRAIPNNAILQQMGWCANTIHGLGSAALRNPESFQEFIHKSERFRVALDFVDHALKHSDTEVLGATILLFDPGYWLERASSEKNEDRKITNIAIAQKLQKLNLWSITQSMFHTIQADHLALRMAWPEAPSMAAEEQLLHALRLSLIERIWSLATHIPYFSPQFSVNRETLDVQIFYLKIPTALETLLRIFPQGTDKTLTLNFYEPASPQHETAYKRENLEIFQPMGKMFDQIREIGVAIMHNNGSFG
ncbi:phosphoenolpyruvate carboxylase [Entomobacter blattae]|uniref:Phosphoenolpyruvate carboxylase n=1 Tax=Entomobacter blattae TaxID=2762277 RepID=A0A7H1NSU9_9PROT|nr:phosphoenolpyruvate carboxylase [Entomobacter blattae]QNT78859.1 Phosphoenolpyruvate carboxylase [Entomobacter blattae]